MSFKNVEHDDTVDGEYDVRQRGFKGWPLETRNLAASQCDSHYQRLIGPQV